MHPNNFEMRVKTFSKESEMIAANSTFQSESALQNRASVVRPGRGRHKQEIEKVTIRMKGRRRSDRKHSRRRQVP